MTWLKKTWAAVKAFVAKHWKAIGVVIIAVVVFIVWRKLKARLSSLLDGFIQSPAKWSKIPGIDSHVVAINPNTGKPETVELPQGVKAREVESIGITAQGGSYEVARLHDPIDRRIDGDTDHSLEL